MGDLRFVVHEHHASSKHFDFRLEMGGVLKSWAVPKGPSLNPKDKRLAMLVDDHTLAYGSYEGIIPAGRYGSGPVVVWDSGTYETLDRGTPEEQFEKGSLKINLQGSVLNGEFSLFKFKASGRASGKEWLLVKKADAFADSQFQLQSALTEGKRKTLRESEPPCEAT